MKKPPDAPAPGGILFVYLRAALAEAQRERVLPQLKVASGVGHDEAGAEEHAALSLQRGARRIHERAGLVLVVEPRVEVDTVVRGADEAVAQIAPRLLGTAREGEAEAAGVLIVQALHMLGGRRGIGHAVIGIEQLAVGGVFVVEHPAARRPELSAVRSGQPGAILPLEAIVDMRLRALTGLEREKLEAEYAELMKKIEEYRAILADRKLLLGVIRKEILVISEKYGDERRTHIGYDEFDISMEDLIPRENVVITVTNMGYIKRMSMDTFKSQNRGGKGIKGMQTLEEDFIRELFVTTSHHYIMFFTNKGRVYRLKAYEIPEAGRTARGTAVINLLQLMPDEKITATIPIKEYEDGKYLFMATKKGLVKKTPIQDYMNVRKTGLAAISLREDDLLIEVKVTDNAQDILLVTKYGQCIRFNEKDVRSTGRVSMGVRGMNLSDNDEIIGMQMSSQGKDMLIVSEKGMGKRTSMEEFTKQNRGGKGVKCYKITEKTGNVVGMKAVDEESEIMIINTEGIVIRMKCSDISQYGRITSGVKLINLPEKERVASVAKVRTASAEIDGEEVEIKEEDDSPENTSEIIVDNSEDNVSDDVENK